MLSALAVFVMLMPSELCAQGLFERRMPERKLVRDGNKEFGKGDYGSSIGYYKEALERDENSFAARFNLGNAYLRDGKYKEAEETFRHIVNNNSYSDYQRAGTWYNLGNMYLEQAESEDVSDSRGQVRPDAGSDGRRDSLLKNSLEAYKASLRLNPSDRDAKYNYAYVKKLLEREQQNQNDDQNDQNNQNNQNNQGGQNDQNDNQNKDDNDRNNDDQNDQNDNRKDDKNNNGDNDNNDNNDNDNNNDNNNPNNDRENSDKKNDENGGDRPSGQSYMSPEQIESMLDAIQAQEDKTQDKLNEKRGVVVRGNKNW